MVVATACLTALFLSLRQDVRSVGYWMALSDKDAQQQLMAAQQASGWSSASDCPAWWADWRQTNNWKGMTPEKQQKIHEQAAMLFFQKPPVSPVGPQPGGSNRLVFACTNCKQGKKQRFIEYKGLYPQLILQKSGKTDRGERCPKLTVAADRLVAYLFHGKPAAKQVVCHYDVAEASREQWEPKLSSLKTPSNACWFPEYGRCLSHACVSPLCLHWNTQAENARTGSNIRQMPQRLARIKIP
jgi:hypothetical protein